MLSCMSTCLQHPSRQTRYLQAVSCVLYLFSAHAGCWALALKQRHRNLNVQLLRFLGKPDALTKRHGTKSEQSIAPFLFPFPPSTPQLLVLLRHPHSQLRPTWTDLNITPPSRSLVTALRASGHDFSGACSDINLCLQVLRYGGSVSPEQVIYPKLCLGACVGPGPCPALHLLGRPRGSPCPASVRHSVSQSDTSSIIHHPSTHTHTHTHTHT